MICVYIDMMCIYIYDICIYTLHIEGYLRTMIFTIYIYRYIEIYFRKVYGYVCIIVVDDTYTYNHLVGEMVLQQDHPGLHLMLIYFLYTVNRPRTF